MVVVTEGRDAPAPTVDESPEQIRSHVDNKKYGYDLYPERKGDKYKPGIRKILSGEGREGTDNIKCERNVYKCVKKSPLVKLMMGALKSSGKFRPSRSIQSLKS